MSITEERKQNVDFTKKYYHTPIRFATKKGSNVEISKAGLTGKRVAVQRATTHDSFLTDNYGDAVEIVRYGTLDEAKLDLVAGRVDLLFGDTVALNEGLLKTDAGKDFEFVGPAYSEEKWFGSGVGIAIRKSDTDLRDKFNAAIDAIRANGVWDRIAAKYFDFDIYGS
jgi:arginine/ornithine transport system substrate-binding protein